MKKSLVVALVVVATGVRAYAGAGLKIPYVAPTQGLVKTETAEEKLDGTLTIEGAGKAPLVQILKETFTEEVVTVDGDKVTKEKVSVASAHSTVEAMGQKKDGDLPIAGKSYVVTADIGSVSVAAADGKSPVDPGEQKLIIQLSNGVGKSDTFGKMMSTKTFVKGKKVTLTPEELASAMGTQEGMTASDVSFTLTSQDGKTATFALVGTLKGSQNGMDVTIKLKGTAKIDIATSRPLDMNMTGTVKGSGTVSGKKLQLTGKMTARKTATYN